VPKVQQTGEAGGGRASRARRTASTLAEINVVPLVDVMLVLLIIFMVTAPLIQRGIDVNLPVARRAPQITGERIEITVPASYRTDHIVYLGTEPIRREILEERIRQRLQTATQKEVYLRGDRGVNLGEISEVFDALTGAGVRQLGFVTKMPGEQ
jgi:biopolymer transport protein ExbD